MNFKKTLSLIILLLGLLSTSYAQLKVASIFGDNMVLEHSETVLFWGWAKKGEKVKIKTSWTKSEITVKANKKGRWEVKLMTPKASFVPNTITVEGDSTIEIKNILFGEVWVCSGQSNMEMPVRGFKNQPVYGSNKLMVESRNSHIRHFKLKNNYTNDLQADCEGNWTEASPQTVGDYSAVGYVFSKVLSKALNVPIGIINTTWGGTPAEAWTDRKTLESEFKDVDLKVIDAGTMKFKAPTVLYNAMINPIVGFKIKGVIWYQGEGNVVRPMQYRKLFPAMISCWRKNWQQGDFPFYYVQICPMQSYDKGGRKSYLLREAQLQTMDAIPNTGMVSTLDIGEQWGIHPPQKIQIGERLAYWALNKQYGLKYFQYGGPLYKSMETIENKAIIEFKNAPQGISAKSMELSGFLVAGADSVFYPANAKIKVEWSKPNNERRPLVQVWSEKVPVPVAVRYGWSNWTEGALFDTAGNPASSFRTDNWNNFKLGVVTK